MSKYSRSSKFLVREQQFMWNKESEFGSIFIFWISSISRFLQLIKFSGFFFFDSAVNSLNWLNNNLRFGGGLSVNILLSFAYFPTDVSIHFRVVMDERMKILIVEISERKCFTGIFKANPGGHYYCH